MADDYPRQERYPNLRRGGLRGNPDTARRGREAKAAKRAALDHLADLAGDDPHAAYEELHAVMTRHIVAMLRAEEREGKQPSRNVTDRLREYRQTTEALAEYRRSRGHDAEAQAFLAELDARLATVADRIEAQPVVEPPPEPPPAA